MGMTQPIRWILVMEGSDTATEARKSTLRKWRKQRLPDDWPHFVGKTVKIAGLQSSFNRLQDGWLMGERDCGECASFSFITW